MYNCVRILAHMEWEANTGPGTAHGREKPYPSLRGGGIRDPSTTTTDTVHPPSLKSRLSPPPANPHFSLSCAATSLAFAAESETPISGSPQRTEQPRLPARSALSSPSLQVFFSSRSLAVSLVTFLFALRRPIWCDGGSGSIWRCYPCGSAPIRWEY